MYGTATPGAHVTVTVKKSAGDSWTSPPVQVLSTGNNETVGTWKVLLPTYPATPPGDAGFAISAECSDCTNSSATATLSGALFGDVWMCSGTRLLGCCFSAYGRVEHVRLQVGLAFHVHNLLLPCMWHVSRFCLASCISWEPAHSLLTSK